MSDATIDELVDTLFGEVVSHTQRLGIFDSVNGGEPKRAPGTGLTAAVWVQRIDPVALASGLAATSARLEFRVRLYTSMIAQPEAAVDPRLLSATVKLIAAYSLDFTLAGEVRNIDLLAAHGPGLGGMAGYIEQDGKMFRIMEIVLPMILNDVFEQGE